jgi:hypothetical protein
MVNFLSFHNPNPGALFLFEIVSRQLARLNLSIERGELLFGHFLERSGSLGCCHTRNSRAGDTLLRGVELDHDF